MFTKYDSNANTQVSMYFKKIHFFASHAVIIVKTFPVNVSITNVGLILTKLKALLDGRVRLGESQVRLTESKCWWKELRLHIGSSVSLTLSQEGCPSVALLAHVLIGEKIKCYLALIFAHGDTIYLYSCYCW